MRRTWRKLKQLGMQRNKEFGLFKKPPLLLQQNHSINESLYLTLNPSDLSGRGLDTE
jgi:hypothetical protein